MMHCRLAVSEPLRETIRRLPPDLKKKVKLAFAEIIQNPDCGKPLKEELEGRFTYKVGKFRIIYRGHPSYVEIVAFGPRRTIYQEAVLALKRAKTQQT